MVWGFLRRAGSRVAGRGQSWIYPGPQLTRRSTTDQGKPGVIAAAMVLELSRREMETQRRRRGGRTKTSQVSWIIDCSGGGVSQEEGGSKGGRLDLSLWEALLITPNSSPRLTMLPSTPKSPSPTPSPTPSPGESPDPEARGCNLRLLLDTSHSPCLSKVPNSRPSQPLPLPSLCPLSPSAPTLPLALCPCLHPPLTDLQQQASWGPAPSPHPPTPHPHPPTPPPPVSELSTGRSGHVICTPPSGRPVWQGGEDYTRQRGAVDYDWGACGRVKST